MARFGARLDSVVWLDVVGVHLGDQSLLATAIGRMVGDEIAGLRVFWLPRKTWSDVQRAQRRR